MENMPPAVHSKSTAAYCAAHAAFTKGISSSKIHKDTIYWRKWDSFWRWLQIPPDLHCIRYPVPFLQIFAHKVRTGVLLVKKKDIQKRSMEQYIRSLGQIFAAMRGPNPQFDRVGSINFRLVQQLTVYKREYHLLSRVRPLHISVLHTLDVTSQGGNELQQAITNLAWITFFFLLRPGEYCQGGTDTVSTPFRLRYIQFYVGNQLPPATTAAPHQCVTSTFVSILFTTQKNVVKGKSIGHSITGHPRACAVAAIRRCVAYLQNYGTTSHIPLDGVFHKLKCNSI